MSQQVQAPSAQPAPVIVCRGPAMEVMRDEDDGVRWCFQCRSRVSFRFQVLAPVEPSYYGPNPRIACEHGHTDGDCGFGRVREWEEAE